MTNTTQYDFCLFSPESTIPSLWCFLPIINKRKTLAWPDMNFQVNLLCLLIYNKSNDLEPTALKKTDLEIIYWTINSSRSNRIIPCSSENKPIIMLESCSIRCQNIMTRTYSEWWLKSKTQSKQNNSNKADTHTPTPSPTPQTKTKTKQNKQTNKTKHENRTKMDNFSKSYFSKSRRHQYLLTSSNSSNII